MDTYVDYKRALNFVHRINALVEDTPSLQRIFLYKGSNLWQSFQGALFVDAKQWTLSGNTEEVNQSLSVHHLIKNIFTILWMLGITGISALLLIFSRRKTVVFTTDKTNGRFKNDFRLESLYEVLSEEGEKFFEIIHCIPGREMLVNFFARKRPVMYLEAIDAVSYPSIRLKKIQLNQEWKNIELPGFTPEEKRLVRLILVKYATSVEIFRWRNIFFEAVFALSGVRRLCAIDDVRHYNEIIFSARRKGIYTYAIEHGHFTKYHTGWLNMTNLLGEIIHPDKLLVWSEYWKNELLRLGTYFKEEEIVVAGSSMAPGLPLTKEPSEGISILIPYETDAPKKEVSNYIKKFLEIEGASIIFKTRPDQSSVSQLEEYGLYESPRIKAVSTTQEALEKAAIVVGTYSTFLYDMVLREKPVAILTTAIDYGEGMIENDLAEKIVLDAYLKEKIIALAKTSQSTLRKRREKLVGSDRALKETLRGIIKHNA